VRVEVVLVEAIQSGGVGVPRPVDSLRQAFHEATRGEAGVYVVNRAGMPPAEEVTW
jgi:hypothetical protein